MNKNEEAVLVPRIRFPEFSEEWESILFGKAFDFQQTNTFSRNQMNTQKGKVRNIHYGDVLIKYGYVLHDISTIPFVNEDVDTDKYKNSYLQNGDVVIADTAEDLMAGKAVEIQNVDCNILAGLHTMLCRPNEQAAPGFWGYYINSPAYHNSIIPLITGAKVSSISKSNIFKTSVVTTDFAEQQKIADCLSSLDDLITAEDKKLEALRAHKKGLMQKLFPAEGQTVPEWRFPEFRGSGEWEEKKITCIAKTSIGLVTTMTENYVENGVKLIRNSDIKANQIQKDNLINLDILFAEKNRNRKLRESDIVTVHTGDVGTSAVIDGDMVGSIGFATLNTRPNKSIINPYFLCWYYNSPRNINYGIKMSTGDGRNNYNLRDFDNAIIPFPSLNEQQKIADCLSSIDDLITEQVKKIEALRTHKKGLMQGLFPSIEEVGE